MFYDKKGIFIKKARKKYNNTLTEIDGIKFDSKSEAKYYCNLKLRERAREIKDLKIHPVYGIYMNEIYICNVELDFEFYDIQRNRKVFIDVKGKDTSISRLKRKLLQAQNYIKVELEK